MRPLLTIAIPTYNRQELLASSLDLVMKYSLGKNVEILISDNASTDNTSAYISEFIQVNPSIKYYRNQSNLGFDGNFLNCFEKSSGKYVWLLSDDDIILPGAIESVLDAIKYEPVCIHLNSSSLISTNPLKYKNPRFAQNGQKIYEDKNEFVKEIGIYCTFVSSLVFNLDYVRKINNKEQYFKTNILQSHILLATMQNKGLYIINTFNCLAARSNNKVNYDVLVTWVKNYSDLLLKTAIKFGFKEQIMKYILEIGLSTTVYEFIINFRQTCENENEWDRECIWPYINLFPKLKRKYEVAISCSQNYLKILKIKHHLIHKILYKMK